VNSALDNPTNFFAAKAHTNRASDLASLKDGMSEAVQVIKAADEGISAVASMIESAKGLAQAAQTATNGKSSRVDFSLSSPFSVGDRVTINGQTFTAIGGSATGLFSGNSFYITNSDGEALNNSAVFNLAMAMEANNSFTGKVITNGSKAGGWFYLSATSPDLYFEGVSETGMTFSATPNNIRGERYDLAQQYNSLMSQLDSLVEDAHYKGADTNLLLGTTELTVSFETGHTLSIEGFSAKAADLGGNISVSTNNWSDSSDITTDIAKLDAALSTLRTESKSLASNLSVINTRQDFTTSMINTLTDGADNLTLADMNEEGANMLMLQTRQQLGTTSLSLSSQAAQAVLRLF
jgi:flagellin-like hook-associated protein FlgL